MYSIKPYKKDSDYSYALGVFPALELISARPDKVAGVILSPRGRDNEGVGKISAFASSRGIPVSWDDKTLVKISKKENCFAAAVFDKYSCELDPGASHLVLVNPSDMGNLGTIIRTAVAFGTGGMAIISPAADIFDPKVVRASMGAVFKLDFKYFSGYNEYADSVGDRPRAFVPFMLNGEPVLKVADRVMAEKKPVSLIFGNESSGLPGYFTGIGTPARIMHLDTVDSLNLPTAVGIGLYAFTDLNR